MQWAGFPNILDTRQFKERKTLDELFQLSDEMRRRCRCRQHIKDADGMILVSLFYEPSTRTRFSFESAMNRLGGKCISTENALAFSSAAKGESLDDMIRVCSAYGDIIVLRHPDNDAAERAVKYSKVPLINAGSGSFQHPTQSLVDIYTINREIGRIDELKVGFVGDNKKSRTVRSLAYLLAQQRNNELYFISPKILGIEDDIKDWLKSKSGETGVRFAETEKLDDVLSFVDVLYVTRLQLERYFKGYKDLTLEQKEYLYHSRKDSFDKYVKTFADLVKLGRDDEALFEELTAKYKEYTIDNKIADTMKSDGIILHPLPRVDEILQEVDSNPRACYFDQSENGLYTRMAELKYIVDHLRAA